METLQSRVESWIKEQKAKILKVSWGPLQWRMKWPWNGVANGHQRKKLQQEYERRRKQLHDLCIAVKADSVADLQDILCCMVLSECVYKRPSTELVRAVNKFKADFGGQVVSLERVQPSSDHVPHRYLLAEAGDTLFASFVGTKQYKDVMTDANILQGAIFHEDAMEDVDGIETNKSDQSESRKGNGENLWNPLESKSKQLNNKSKPKPKPKPAAHRGFLARAKGIPALELYRLAQKKKRKLVLCGHSLGGAVAALATLAILRVIAASSSLKENENVQVKCITFSQPPVGNAALRDYVHRKGWQHYFKSYCIPEDLVPRILSPAYFHHYNTQLTSVPLDTKDSKVSTLKREESTDKAKDNEGEQLVLGLGPVQNSVWRLSKLVPLDSVRRHLNKYRGIKVGSVEATSDSATTASVEDVVEAQSLEIEEGSDGISLKPISDTTPDLATSSKLAKKSTTKSEDGRNWGGVPYLPSYVPFGELYLLENSSVQSLSDAEYSKLTSVRSVIAELRERLQSHSMKSYRSRFQRIYELCMRDDSSSFIGMEQWQQFPHLQQWLGVAVAGTVELGDIVESPLIRTASSIAPLGWSGVPGQKSSEQLKVDITGFGLHLCNIVHAQVNGKWCSTMVESFPQAPEYGAQPELQKMRVLVGAPLKRPPMQQTSTDTFMHVFPSIDSEASNLNRELISGSPHEEKSLRPEGLSDVFVSCTSDFTTVSKEVYVRTRRVRLLGLEGAGKTSLLKAILSRGRINNTFTNIENLLPETDPQEVIAGGLCYCDSAGINLQELNMEASHFRDELWTGIRDLNRKIDLVILVHNLSHRIPRYSNASPQMPALSLLLDEAKSLGIPWILAMTNKFSVSAHQQKAVIDAVIQAYQASPSTAGIINSCPYVIHSAATASLSLGATDDGRVGAQRFIYAPINFIQRPFQRKETILPVEGVDSLCQLAHRVLRSHEEASLEELCKERLLVELVRDRARAKGAGGDSKAKESSITAAAVGASVGAGLGLVLAVVMGAASALRKP
ncbi:hypothetical protein CsatB_024815 [Cannabis sativa]